VIRCTCGCRKRRGWLFNDALRALCRVEFLFGSLQATKGEPFAPSKAVLLFDASDSDAVRQIISDEAVFPSSLWKDSIIETQYRTLFRNYSWIVNEFWIQVNLLIRKKSPCWHRRSCVRMKPMQQSRFALDVSGLARNPRLTTNLIPVATLTSWAWLANKSESNYGEARQDAGCRTGKRRVRRNTG